MILTRYDGEKKFDGLLCTIKPLAMGFTKIGFALGIDLTVACFSEKSHCLSKCGVFTKIEL
jgi:hypothetical protein